MSDVSIVGLGAMGAALARALLRAGHRVTVWNRARAKAEPLAREGAAVAESVAAAAAASPVVVVCVADYAATHGLLEPREVASALSGKTLVQLSTGSPGDARAAEAWAKARGVDYLDGAIMAMPDQVGKPGATLLVSGAPSAYRRSEPALKGLAGNLKYVGEVVGAAAALDFAILSYIFGGLLGGLHGALIAEVEGLSLEDLGAILIETAPDAAGMAKHMLDVVRKRAYDDAPQATVMTCLRAFESMARHAREANISGAFPAFGLALCRQAADAGHGQREFAAVIEPMRAPRLAPAPPGAPRPGRVVGEGGDDQVEEGAHARAQVAPARVHDAHRAAPRRPPLEQPHQPARVEIARDEELGQLGDAEPRDRPAPHQRRRRGRVAAAHQHRGPLAVALERPGLPPAPRAERDAGVLAQIARPRHRAAPGEVRGRGADAVLDVAEAPGHQRAVGRGARPHGQIDPLFDQIDAAVRDQKVERDALVFAQKPLEHRGQGALEQPGRGHAHEPARRPIARRGGAVGRHRVGHHPAALRVVRRARRGELHVARGALQKPGGEAVFELGHPLRHRRLRHAERLGRRREAARLDHADEDHHLVQIGGHRRVVLAPLGRDCLPR
jgi:3-hydroxyisobutyrate dehydrogenase-like beta-hydroxyacid dehydrogenase